VNRPDQQLKDQASSLVKDLLRRPYVKPKILSDAVFEREAGCGKASPMQMNCLSVRGAS